MVGFIGLAFAALAVAAPQASPQTDPQQPTQLPDVVVERQNLDEVVRSFVAEVNDPLRGQGPARWDRRVCVGVANLRRDVAQLMIDRISSVALEVGLEPGEPGCRPNVLIIAATDGPAMARALVQARPNLFQPNISGTTRSRSELEEFQTNSQPVRWWQVSAPVDSETGMLAARIPGYDPPEISTFSASRLRTQIQYDLQRVFIILDLNQALGLNFNQLSDYTAMVALAQVDPHAQTARFDTVLNLFSDPAGTPSITDWDLSYLRALYSARLDQSQPNAQQNEVARSMTRDQRQDADADD